MRRRPLIAVVAALVALLLLLVLLRTLGRVEPDAGHAARMNPAGAAAEEAARFTTSAAPADDPALPPEAPGQLLPLLDRPAAEPLDEAAPSAPARVRVGAVTSDGRPLADVLDERWPDLPDLEAGWTPDVQGPAPSERELDFDALVALGDDERSEVEDLQVPGYVCTLSIDDPLPVRVVLHLGPKLVATRAAQPGEDDVWFRLQPRDVDGLTGTVKGRVVASGTGEPVAGANVTARRFAIFEFLRSPPQDTTDTEGRFEIDGLLAAAAFLAIEAAGHEQRTLRIQVPGGRGLDLGSIPLDRALTCEGRVVDAQGAPVRANLTLRSAEDSADVFDSLIVGRKLQTDSEGRFSLDALGRRRYLLRAEEATRDADGTSAFLVFEAEADGARELTITLRPETSVTLSGVEADRSWTALALADQSGVVLLSMDEAILRLVAKDDDDPFSLPLTPGRYALRVAKGARVVWSRDFEVGAEPLTIDIPP